MAGPSSSGETVTHTYDDAGVYDVQLTVADDENSTGSAVTTVTVVVREVADSSSGGGGAASPALFLLVGLAGWLTGRRASRARVRTVGRDSP
jgi:hypothetical protein